MNIRLASMMAVLATAATVFAAEPAAPAEEAAPVVAEVAAPAEEAAPVAAPAEEAAAPAAVEESAPVAAVAPAEEAAPAPVAVRGGDASAKPVKTVYVESRPAQKTVYVQQAEPTNVSVARARGYEPQKLAYGVQAFVGSFFFMEDIFDYDMSGMTWRAGVHLSLPLNDYTSALKVALLYEQSDASTSDNNDYSTSSKIKQRKLNIPVLFDFKGPRSIVSFGVGASVDIPLTDSFSYIGKIDNKKHKFDMIDAEQRSSVDYNLLLGLSIRPHKMLSFDLRYELGFNKLYEDDYNYGLDNTSSAFTMGLSFYILQ